MLETAQLELCEEMRATIRMAGDAVGQTWSALGFDVQTKIG